MNAAPQGISEALARIDAQQVGWANAAARRLARIGIDARIALTEPGAAEWYLGTNYAFRPTSARRAALGAAGETLAAVLSAHEPLLADIETAIGYAAEFSDHGALRDPAAALTLVRSGEALGDLVVRAALEDTEPPAPGTLIALAATAARLDIIDAEALAPGDLVILSRGPWPLFALPPEVTTCSFEPATGRLGAGFPDHIPLQEPYQMADQQTIAATPATLAVPVVVRMTDLLLSPDEIAALAAGGTVDLGPVTEGLEVTLSVGGRTIGRGAVVRLGDRFGVLLEDPLPAAQPAHGDDDTATGFVQLERE